MAEGAYIAAQDAGVSVEDPGTTYVDWGVEVGREGMKAVKVDLLAPI